MQCLIWISEISCCLEEFESFLNILGEDIIWSFICGDFNFWLDCPEDPDTKKFLEVLNSFSIKNIVQSPTARSGHTLDLVLTDDKSNLATNVEVEKFCWREGELFHYAVNFDINILRKTNTVKEIKYRDKKSFDAIKFIDTSHAELLAAVEDPCLCTPSQRLRNAGIEVLDCIPVTGEITAENEHYLRTKADRAGHLLDVDALIQAAQ